LEKRLCEKEEQLHQQDKTIQDQKTLIQDQAEEIEELGNLESHLKKYSDGKYKKVVQHKQKLEDQEKRLVEQESYIKKLEQEAQISRAVQQKALTRRQSAYLLGGRLLEDIEEIKEKRRKARKAELEAARLVADENNSREVRDKAKVKEKTERERERHLAKKESLAQKDLDDADSRLAWIDGLLAYPEAQNQPIVADRSHTRSASRGPQLDSGYGTHNPASRLSARFGSHGPQSDSDYGTPSSASQLSARFGIRGPQSDSGYGSLSPASEISQDRSSSSYPNDPQLPSSDVPPEVPMPPSALQRPPERLNHKDKKHHLRHPGKPP
jgi:hypothetical protein